jgi:hypothetical protein
MWLTGGFVGSGPQLNDVWFSADGVNWTCATDSAPWPARCAHEAVAFNNKIWLMGGISGSTVFNDVWCSSDGVNWTCVADSAPWYGRLDYTMALLDGRMWLMGGMTLSWPLHDVWYSSDGDSWTCATATANWPGRAGLTSVVFDNKLWVMGGYPPNPDRLNDVWYSSDGVDWTCADSAADWRPRGWHTSLVYDNKIWVMGGDSTANSLTISDVWYSSGLGIAETPNAEVRTTSPGPTIVRGVLRLADGTRHTACSAGLLDISGRKVLDLQPGANDVSRLSPGVYFVAEPGTTGEEPRASKIVIQH